MPIAADGFTLADLAAIVAARASARAETSYTKSLLDAGAERAAQKFGEEAIEAVVAAVARDAGALVAEAADVLYHLLVVLHVRGVGLQDVMDELERRVGRSGHQEKAARPR